ncbi:family 20 glycosylhydrolase [Candidatus Sumerlaeota bacterium]|nr:family 20 glycosylhydrolase [Candidatus Sumerlaeota bacterium]
MRRIVLSIILLAMSLTAAAADETLFVDHSNDETSMIGFHCVIPPRKDREKMLRLVDELAGMGINTLVLQVDYRLQFRNNPEIGDGMWYTMEEARALAEHCAEKNIRLIPQMSCVGHQSYGGGASALNLLKKHPEFDETPRIPQASDEILYREWCVSNDDVYPVVFSLMDEIADAFQAREFHVGMDEIFLMGDGKCDRCRGKDRSLLLAQAINKLHAHIVDERRMTMYMWGDRLLDGKATRYGKWEGSENDTFRAIDIIPKDIVLCDWHYEVRDAYPSVEIFLRKGFRVWPAVWREEEATRNFIHDAMRTSKARASGPGDAVRTQGVLFTTWVYPEIFGILYGGGDPALSHPYYLQAVRNVQVGMREMGLATTPFPPVFQTDAMAFASKPVSLALSANEGAVIRYTLDGSDVTSTSEQYRAPLTIGKPTVVHARAFNGKGGSLIARAEIRKARTLKAVDAGVVVAGLRGIVHTGVFQKCSDFSKAESQREVMVSSIDSSVAVTKSGFGVEFTGFLKVQEDGVYTFHLGSKDGSVLWINNRKIVDNDGIHVMQWREGVIDLKKGMHPIRLAYFSKAGDGALQLEWKGPGIPRGPISSDALFRGK